MNTSKKLSGSKFNAASKRIKRRNAAFAKKTISQQRVQIAKDVIAFLKSGVLVADSNYLQLDNKTQDLKYSSDGIPDVEANVALEAMGTTCTVCGIGSLFVATLMRKNKLKLHDLFNQGNVKRMEINYLAGYFDHTQLDFVEYYFEANGNDRGGSPIMSTYDDTKRLTMIMENIISNKGKFNPKKGMHRDA